METATSTYLRTKKEKGRQARKKEKSRTGVKQKREKEFGPKRETSTIIVPKRKRNPFDGECKSHQ